VNATPDGEIRPATARTSGHRPPGAATAETPAEAGEGHRLCVFELDLTCGHCVTVAVDGWYPVSVACCDRLGGTWAGGTYIPFSSTVEHVRVVAERYERRPPGAEREPAQLLARRARIDDPVVPSHPWQQGSAGRYPARVGGPAPDPRHTPPVHQADRG
jgi:hypothetical protein